jgi:hypothetical protein
MGNAMIAMNRPSVVGRVLFVDGIERDVSEDADGRQWVVGYGGGSGSTGCG